MLGSPPDMDADAVIRAMMELGGGRDVHHVHLWQMQEHEVTLDCHVVLEDDNWSRLRAVKSALKERLEEDFGIGHSSLEFETSDERHENADLFGHDDLSADASAGASASADR